jgi:hypothetical protein
MRNLRFLAILLGALQLAVAAPATMLNRQPDFDSRSLVTSGGSSVSGFSLTNPSRFSMHQSYSVMAASSSAGSMSSSMYLNTIGYKISDPLLLFVDVGFHTPLYSSMQGMNGNTGAAASSVILPRFGLEYKPTERLSINLELVNGPDAWKAYGPGYGLGSSFYGSRFP